MGSIYWSGVFPGLIFGTIVSVGIARSLPRTKGAMVHVLWLVPGLHFGGAFLIGPAAALAYGVGVVPLWGGWSPVVWIAGLTLVGLAIAALCWRQPGPRRSVGLGVAVGVVVCLGWLLPPAYWLLGG